MNNSKDANRSLAVPRAGYIISHYFTAAAPTLTASFDSSGIFSRLLT